MTTTWAKLAEAVRHLEEPFRRSEIIGWFRRHHPEVNEGVNAPARGLPDVVLVSCTKPQASARRSGGTALPRFELRQGDRVRRAARGAVEGQLLAELDPPLNLRGVPPTPLRRRLSQLRRGLR